MFKRSKAMLGALALVGAMGSFVSAPSADAATQTCYKGNFCIYGRVPGNGGALILQKGSDWTGRLPVSFGQVWNNGNRHVNKDHIDVVIDTGTARYTTCLHFGPAAYDWETDAPTLRSMLGGVVVRVTWRGECQSHEDNDWIRLQS